MAYKGGHRAAVLVAAPVVGVLFAIFFPAMVIVTAVALGAVKLFQTAVPGVSFGWSPVEAYLTGRKRRAVSRKVRR